MPKSKIIVLSDIHIGTNKPTVWYQKEFHQPYLIAILDWIISNASDIWELILLGDIVDFWTYPPDEQPPTFKDIREANPDIFGPSGKLSQVLTALQGNITYVRGNHDMNITQQDLDQIQNSSYKIKLSPSDIYYPLPNGNKKIACTHGHIFTMFNAPYNDTRFAPLPVGHFVTRSVVYQLKQTLKPGQTVADLPNQGSPNGVDYGEVIKLIPSVFTPDFGITQLLLDYITKVTGMPQNQLIKLPNGDQTTIAEAKKIYSNLWSYWVSKYGGGTNGFLGATKAAIADNDGSYMGWFAQKMALEGGSDLVVMGHTHTAISGLNKAMIQYVNSGFECPSKPDIITHHSTFTEIDTVNCQAKVLEVINQGGQYKIQPNNARRDSVVVYPSQDFSCYITVDNTYGTDELKRIDNWKAQHGYYIVEPPTSIPPGKKGRFWIQDYPGTVGTEGQVTYTTAKGSQFNLTYACPTLSSNKCAGADFYTSNDGVNWGKLNQIVDSGVGNNHPFFVRFSIPGPIPKPPFSDAEYPCEPAIANSGNDWAKALLGCTTWTLNPTEGGTFNSADQCIDSVDPPSTKGLLTVLVGGPSTDVNCISYICVGGPGAGEVDVAIYPGSKYLGWNGSRFVDGPAINSNGYYWYRLAVQWKKPYADPNAVFYAKSYRNQVPGQAKPFKIWAYKNVLLGN